MNRLGYLISSRTHYKPKFFNFAVEHSAMEVSISSGTHLASKRLMMSEIIVAQTRWTVSIIEFSSAYIFTPSRYLRFIRNALVLPVAKKKCCVAQAEHYIERICLAQFHSNGRMRISAHANTVAYAGTRILEHSHKWVRTAAAWTLCLAKIHIWNRNGDERSEHLAIGVQYAWHIGSNRQVCERERKHRRRTLDKFIEP